MPDPGSDPIDPVRSAPEIAKHVIASPKEFFAEVPREGGYEAPGLFAAAMLVAHGAILAVYALLGIGVGGFFHSLIILPILGGLALLVWAAILFFVSQALGGQATYESTFRIVAYTSAVVPIAAAVSIVPYAPLLANAYGLYLTILGVIALNRVAEASAWRIIGGVGAVLLLLSFLGTLAAHRMEPTFDRWDDEMEQDRVQD